MKYEKYDKIIEENRFNMTFMYIYYSLKCNEKFINSEEFKMLQDGKTSEYVDALVHFIHKAWLKDDNHIDLGLICDKAVEYKDDILNDEDFSTWDLLSECEVVL